MPSPTRWPVRRANLKTLTDRLNSGEGTAGKLMTDPALFNQLKSLADRLDLLTKYSTTVKARSDTC